MSVRLPSDERYVAQVAKEHGCLPILASLLPLPILTPLALGLPQRGYPWHWSIHRWLEGETAASVDVPDPVRFAVSLCEFLIALQQVKPDGGPTPGQHNFFRGGALSVYDSKTRSAIEVLQGRIDAHAITAILGGGTRFDLAEPTCLDPRRHEGEQPVLANDGKLCAVIDFGNLAVGDPERDLTIAWTFFSGEARDAFRATLQLDGATWVRSRGWALWKALITLKESFGPDPIKTCEAQRVIDEVLADQ